AVVYGYDGKIARFRILVGGNQHILRRVLVRFDPFVTGPDEAAVIAEGVISLEDAEQIVFRGGDPLIRPVVGKSDQIGTVRAVVGGGPPPEIGAHAGDVEHVSDEGGVFQAVFDRSEERRVGKGWR